MTILNDDFSIIGKWSSKLIDNARVAIYDPDLFIMQPTYKKTMQEMFATDKRSSLFFPPASKVL
jgi:hypothetical protein